VKWGEPSEVALRREIREETALEIAEVAFVLVQDCIHSKEFYREAHFVLLNYTARAPGQQAVKLNGEAQEYRWLSLAAAVQMPINMPTRTLLETVAKMRPAN
jgi:ADP-ribose pyrophosphatase YjhB (NUDIX family)